MSNENNLIYSHHSNTRGRDKNIVFIAVKSHSILYSSKIVYLQIDWFTGDNGLWLSTSEFTGLNTLIAGVPFKLYSMTIVGFDNVFLRAV